ncbi:hypothetical protein QBC38DRAFT_480419 [Podospora fimiseda]|uniref:Uncharacterized protein n=1 Tax=Podospora fimiseda TaxID=252190 RepID=A0AAN7BN92_9PEZI|nr:hypothetical protein QBC38DRAFT_480419 [Podospora fimiseda]
MCGCVGCVVFICVEIDSFYLRFIFCEVVFWFWLPCMVLWCSDLLYPGFVQVISSAPVYYIFLLSCVVCVISAKLDHQGGGRRRRRGRFSPSKYVVIS